MSTSFAITSTAAQRLLPNHLDDLRRSGLSDDTIGRWGCYSVAEHSEIRALRFGHLEPPAIALPVLPPDRTEPDATDVMLKPDLPRIDKRGRAAKYETRANSRMQGKRRICVGRLGARSISAQRRKARRPRYSPTRASGPRRNGDYSSRIPLSKRCTKS